MIPLQISKNVFQRYCFLGFFYFVFYSWGQLIYLLRLGHEVYYPGWEYWNQRRFQSSERGRCFAEKLLAVQTAGLAEPRIREFPGSRALLTHRQTAPPTHLLSSLHPCPPQRGGLHCPPTPTPTPLLSSLFLCSTPSFSAAWIHPTWPQAEIFTLNTMSVLKKSQIWVQLRLRCSSCVWRQLVHPSKVHDVSESKLALPSTWENF